MDNPPAFPQSLNSEGPFGGMTLRDYFAGLALVGILSAPIGKFKCTKSAEAARDAYIFADAMLAQRKEKNDG